MGILFQAADRGLTALSVEGQALVVRAGGLVEVPTHLVDLFSQGDFALRYRPVRVAEDDDTAPSAPPQPTTPLPPIPVSTVGEGQSPMERAKIAAAEASASPAKK